MWGLHGSYLGLHADKYADAILAVRWYDLDGYGLRVS